MAEGTGVECGFCPVRFFGTDRMDRLERHLLLAHPETVLDLPSLIARRRIA